MYRPLRPFPETTEQISAEYFRFRTYPQEIPAGDAKVVDFPTDACLRSVTLV
jgi:hypothetical protein